MGSAGIAIQLELFGLVFAVALLPQFAAYQILNGQPKPASEVSGRINWCSPHFFDTLVDYHPTASFWCRTVGDFTIDFPNFSRGALVWAAFLFTGFSAALIWARFHHLSLTCVCFGRLDSTLHRLPHGLALHILLTVTVSGSLIYLLWRGETVAED